MNLRDQFGSIDIYVFDQLLRGRFAPGASLLDAGCGGGRNLTYFLRNGYEVFGVDTDPAAIDAVQRLARELAPHLSPQNFAVADVASMPFATARFDAVLCNALLHFARDEEHFAAMFDELWRVLRPGGVFFARLASTIGLEARVIKHHSRWYGLPDGSDRFLVDAAFLNAAAERLGAVWLDPLKTTNVQDLRCMTTWVLQKKA